MGLETINVTLRKLTPNNPDNWLTNGETYSRTVYLGKDDRADNWLEITQAEYDAAMTTGDAEDLKMPD